MLPFLANRPLSLVRCPRGREQKCFFQKHFADSVPDFVHITKIEEKEGRAPYSYVDDADGLVSLAQWGVIEFHPWGSRVDRTDRPDVLIFDLDPNPDVKWEEVLGATFLVRDILENELDLESFVKTSGGKGLHVYVPIERYSDWDEAREFTKSVSEAVKRQNPSKFVTVSTKAKREGKIFIDYLRNGRGSTSVAPFSPRARECAPVSVPIGWHEISPDLRADQYTLENIFKRLGALKEDPWKNFFDVKQRISKSLLEKVKKL
jgi:bifunctional non-homologous end joining protein LigD